MEFRNLRVIPGSLLHHPHIALYAGQNAMVIYFGLFQQMGIVGAKALSVYTSRKRALPSAFMQQLYIPAKMQTAGKQKVRYT